MFDGRLNPNGCPIRGTFFVAHEYSNYQLIQQAHYEGHEIATYSVRFVRVSLMINYYVIYTINFVNFLLLII